MMFPFAFADQDHTSVRNFADRMFELDGRVVDAEVLQQAFHVARDGFAD
jgi:hypothetical protein